MPQIRPKQLAQDGATSEGLLAWNNATGKWRSVRRMWGESVTSQAITDSDTAITDTLNNTPISGSVRIWMNGVRYFEGSGIDWTISGTAITWLASSGTAPNMKTTDVLFVDYEF